MPLRTKPLSRHDTFVAAKDAVPAATSAATAPVGKATVQKTPLLAIPGL
jgi:hypothetical protein